jgi:hypothetical protein
LRQKLLGWLRLACDSLQVTANKTLA